MTYLNVHPFTSMDFCSHQLTKPRSLSVSVISNFKQSQNHAPLRLSGVYL